MKTKNSKVVQTAEELQAAQTAVKSCRTTEASRKKAYENSHETTIKAEERKAIALEAHQAALRELR